MTRFVSGGWWVTLVLAAVMSCGGRTDDSGFGGDKHSGGTPSASSTGGSGQSGGRGGYSGGDTGTGGAGAGADPSSGGSGGSSVNRNPCAGVRCAGPNCPPGSTIISLPGQCCPSCSPEMVDASTGGVTSSGGTTSTGGTPHEGGVAPTGGTTSIGGTSNTGGSSLVECSGHICRGPCIPAFVSCCKADNTCGCQEAFFPTGCN
jgi:hypothetical protein